MASKYHGMGLWILQPEQLDIQAPLPSVWAASGSMDFSEANCCAYSPPDLRTSGRQRRFERQRWNRQGQAGAGSACCCGAPSTTGSSSHSGRAASRAFGRHEGMEATEAVALAVQGVDARHCLAVRCAVGWQSPTASCRHQARASGIAAIVRAHQVCHRRLDEEQEEACLCLDRLPGCLDRRAESRGGGCWTGSRPASSVRATGPRGRAAAFVVEDGYDDDMANPFVDHADIVTAPEANWQRPPAALAASGPFRLGHLLWLSCRLRCGQPHRRRPNAWRTMHGATKSRST